MGFRHELGRIISLSRFLGPASTIWMDESARPTQDLEPSEKPKPVKRIQERAQFSADTEELMVIKTLKALRDSVGRKEKATLVLGGLYRHDTNPNHPLMLEVNGLIYDAIRFNSVFLQLANMEFPQGSIDYLAPAYWQDPNSSVLHMTKGIRVEIPDTNGEVSMYLNRDEEHDKIPGGSFYHPAREKWYTTIGLPPHPNPINEKISS